MPNPIRTALSDIINFLVLVTSGWAVLANVLGGIGVPAKIASVIFAVLTMVLAVARDLYGLKIGVALAERPAVPHG